VPVEIVWSPLARARLHETLAYVALVYVTKAKPDAAERLATRIVAVVEALRNHPRLGRAGTEPGIRELVIGGTPYVVLYRVRGRQVIISTMWHGTQRKEL
jgi:toxin ParE1/3/4